MCDRKTPYELGRLERIIVTDIDSILEIEHELFVAFKQTIRIEMDRVKNSLAQASVRLMKKRELKRHIQFHQHAIVRLEGYLVNYVHPERIMLKSERSDRHAVCQYLYDYLEELLTFVSDQFPIQFDLDAWIPDGYRSIVSHQVKQDLALLKLGLSKTMTDNELLTHALRPFEDFLNSNDHVTHRRIIFIRGLQRALLGLIKNQTHDFRLNLQWALFQYNLNSFSYFQYCVQQLTGHINEVTSDQERLDRLAHVRKLIFQNHIKPGYADDPEMPPLKMQLADWIDQEMNYIEMRLHRLSVPDDGKDTIRTVSKTKIDLSVSQLAYLLRVLVEVNVLQSNTVTSLLKWIPNFIQTKRTESIGLASLQAKYYKPEHGARKAVRDLLLSMAKHIEKSEPIV